MGDSVYIDGRPAECREDYNEVIGQLGAAPDESRKRFELWTTQPRGRVTSRSVWPNPGSDSGRAECVLFGKVNRTFENTRKAPLRTVSETGCGRKIQQPMRVASQI